MPFYTVKLAQKPSKPFHLHQIYLGIIYQDSHWLLKPMQIWVQIPRIKIFSVKKQFDYSDKYSVKFSCRITKQDPYQGPGGGNGLHCPQVCRWHQSRGERLTCLRAALSSREIWTGWRGELTGTLWNSARTKIEPGNGTGRSLPGWKGPGGRQLSISQQRAWQQGWTTASQALSAGARPTDGWKGSSPLIQWSSDHSWNTASSSAPSCPRKKDIDQTKQVQHRVPGLLRLEHLPCQGKLGVLGCSRLEKGWLWGT